MTASTHRLVRWACLILAVTLPLLLIPAQAQAEPLTTPAPAPTLTISVDGKNYTLSTLSGSYNDNAAALQNQPWWGKSGVAQQFANQYYAVVATTIDGATLNLFSHTYNLVNANVYSVIYDGSDDTVFSSNQSAGYSSVTQTFMTATLSVPEINAGSLSQALLILFALWLVTRRRAASHVA